MSSNLVTINSPEHFQEVLSADLERVSVTNFWAPWAEPCKAMHDVVDELAKKYSKILFLNVDADQLPDISESFGVESVPHFIVLKGHGLLGRVAGADTKALTDIIEKHSQDASKPLSTSDKAPVAAPPPATEPKQPETELETEEELNGRMRGIMNSDKVVLFMKGSPDAPRCGFSRQTVEILRKNEVTFTHFDILQDEAVRQGLKKLNNWPTFPQLIIGGELLGGLDILREMEENGEFQEALEGVGAK